MIAHKIPPIRITPLALLVVLVGASGSPAQDSIAHPQDEGAGFLDRTRLEVSAGLGDIESSFGLMLRADGAYSFESSPWGIGAELSLGFSSDNSVLRFSPYAEYDFEIDENLLIRPQAGIDFYSFDQDVGPYSLSYDAIGVRFGAEVEYDLADSIGQGWTGIGAVHLGFLSGDVSVTVGSSSGSASDSIASFEFEIGARYDLPEAGELGASLLVQSHDYGDFVGIFGTYTF